MADMHVNGQPWRQQHQFNTTQSSAITSWGTGTAFPIEVMAGSIAVTKNRVFHIGGYDLDNVLISSIYTAPINTDGTIGSWSGAGNFPIAIAWAQAVYTADRLYVIGGWGDSGALDIVYTCVVGTDGTLGTWSAAASLPAEKPVAQAVITNGYIHVLTGAEVDSSNHKVFSAPVGSDGIIGTWFTGPAIPDTANEAISGAAVFSTGSYVYIAGGYDEYNDLSSTVYRSSVGTDGTLGSWSTVTALPAAVFGHCSVITSGRAWVIGGWTESGIDAVYSAPVNSSGVIGTWGTDESLTVGAQYAGCFITSSRIYLVGGWTDDGCTDSVRVASFSGGLNDYSEEVYDVNPGVNPPLETISGFGYSIIPISCDGEIDPPIESVVSTAHMTVTAIGVISSMPEVITSTATTKWAVGRISPILADNITAQGETPAAGWGMIRPMTTRFFATGISGIPISAGQISQPRETIAATGGTTIAGFGRIAERSSVVGAHGWSTIYGHGQGSDMPPVVAAAGNVPVFIVGTGRINDYAPIIFSSGSPAILGWGAVGGPLADISATGFIGIISAGRIASQPQVVSSRGTSGAWSGILQFERNQVIRATSPATVTSPISFSR